MKCKSNATGPARCNGVLKHCSTMDPIRETLWLSDHTGFFGSGRREWSHNPPSEVDRTGRENAISEPSVVNMRQKHRSESFSSKGVFEII